MIWASSKIGKSSRWFHFPKWKHYSWVLMHSLSTKLICEGGTCMTWIWIPNTHFNTVLGMIFYCVGGMLWVCMYHRQYMEVRGQLLRISSLLTFNMSPKDHTHVKLSWQLLLPTEPCQFRGSYLLWLAKTSIKFYINFSLLATKYFHPINELTLK